MFTRNIPTDYLSSTTTLPSDKSQHNDTTITENISTIRMNPNLYLIKYYIYNEKNYRFTDTLNINIS